MFDQDTIYLKVTISKEVGSRFKVYVANKYPDFLRGPLSKEVEKALNYYLDSKEEIKNKGIKDFNSTRTHRLNKHAQRIQDNNSLKYNNLIESIKRYSNSNKQISSGLAKKAISQNIGMDKRTINKYLKILQDNDVLYASSVMGMFDVQSWIFGDYEVKHQQINQQIEIDTHK
jgi:hypothetical protein